MSEEEKVVLEATAEEAPKQDDVMKMVLHDESQPIITMKKLLEGGVHFGHQTRKWNPKMARYIYGARNGIYIIDLAKSAEAISVAYKALYDIVSQNGKVLFVGTKKQCQEAVTEEALRSGSFYITNRWLGGTLTNYKTIESRIRYLKQLEAKETDGVLERLPKKEAALLRKEKDKLSFTLSGIKEMRRLPQAVIVVDPDIERNAVREARKLKIPVFGIVDTNSDPDVLDYPIPANDDAVRSVRLIISVLADAVVEAKGGIPVVAYTKDEGEEVTMKDAIRQADKENQERLAAIRAARKERQERYERYQSMRSTKREDYSRDRRPEVKEVKEVKEEAEKAPVAEQKVEPEVKAEEPKPVKKATKKAAPAAEEEVKEEDK
ncbi:MAG: 30S ribosomal protein S2 [Bacilli bacterium]|nr:30S ribosomal protein S2 [Bacilli bacterium]